jgi:membrane associated rhomboid family serine protease/antitoxin component YwqK of YwqJK toxin-antitoxin module
LISRYIKQIANFRATYLLIAVNSIVFAIYGFERITSARLLDMGANFAPYSLGDEPFRLITSMFLHGHILHLIANMSALFFVGIQVEKKLGWFNFLIIYFLTGLIAGLASLNLNLFTVSVGASGAIFGIYSFLIVDTIQKNPRNKASILTNFIIYILVVSLIGIRLNFDNAAHLGGVTSGIMVGILYSKIKLSLAYGIISTIIVISLILSPVYQVVYYNAFQKFVSNDHRINSIINARSNDKALYDSIFKIKDLPGENIADFREIDFIPNQLKRDTSLVVDYLNLRLKQIEFFLKGLSMESFIYVDSINLIAYEINNLPQVKYNLNYEMEPPPERINRDTSEQLSMVKQYYDSNWFEVDQYKFDYYRIGQKDNIGNWHGRVEDYYKNGAIQMKGNFQRGLKEGIFLYYGPDSTYSSAGRYIQDNPIGKWELFHKNGRLFSEIRHKNGFAYVENLWDSLGNQMIINGTGEEIYRYSNGTINYRRNIENGLNHGFTESFYESGDLRFKEYYENGELLKGISYLNKNVNAYDRSIYTSYPVGGFDSFYKYLDRENRLSSDSIEEVVVIRFDVHSSGKIHNIRLLKRSDEKYNQFAQELLLNGPEWIPARSHGSIEINSFAEVTIRF